MVGHIKIDRKILNWEWYSDYKMVHLFLHLLIKANWTDGMWRGQVIKRGQYMTSISKLSGNTGLSISQIRTCLSKLQSTGEIASEMTNSNTLITICKYDIYQSEKNINSKQNDTQVDKRDSKRDDTPNDTPDSNNIRKQEDKKIIPTGMRSGIAVEMASIFKKYNPNIQIEEDVHYPPCLQIAYRIARMKGWNDMDVLNGKMGETLKSWEKIVVFVKSDEWLSTRSLIDLNNQKEWDRLIQKMNVNKNLTQSKERSGSPIKKESEVDFDKYKKKV